MNQQQSDLRKDDHQCSLPAYQQQHFFEVTESQLSPNYPQQPLVFSSPQQSFRQ
jgi:hypothetical protein